MHIRKGERRFSRALIALMVGGLLLAQAAPQARAGAADDIANLQQKLNQINQERDSATNELQKVQADAKAALTQQQLTEQELAAANAELSAVEADLAATNNELKQVQANLDATQKKYDQRKAALAIRVRAIQENGRVNYLGVLFGATSFSDFISRFDVLKMVIKQDTQLFAAVRADKQELETKKATVADRKSHLEVLRAQEQEHQNQVAEKKAEQEVVSRSLDTRLRALQAQLDEYDTQADQVSQQVWQIQQSQHRAAGRFAPIRPVANSVITDTFGPRMHPILHVWRNHNGTDFAVNMGTPVLAIEDGTVIVAGWDDAFGNLIVIDHGGGIASWYGHSSKLLVKVGDHVVQGQQISEAGSTGWSTGPHCHLEIHVNGVPVDPMTYLN